MLRLELEIGGEGFLGFRSTSPVNGVKKDHTWEEIISISKRDRKKYTSGSKRGELPQLLSEHRRGQQRKVERESKSNGKGNSLRTDALRHFCNEGESPYDKSLHIL